MHQNLTQNGKAQVVKSDFTGVCFNPDDSSIIGSYSDQISAYRAKKCWQEALRLHFNLENSFDFKTAVDNAAEDKYILTCQFISATARYCFWKITNNQSPEVQYVIETAHIPMCEARYEEILKAPDLKSVYDLPLVNNPSAEFRSASLKNKTFGNILRKVLDSNAD